MRRNNDALWSYDDGMGKPPKASALRYAVMGASGGDEGDRRVDGPE
jgi:hypothetical protein